MINPIYFQKALDLAFSVKGNTSPNPAVGAVIVKNDRIISTGATQKAGKDHAEIVAIKSAGKNARDATMYVTLEPCINYPGKLTPSCADAIIKAGITEIFIGSKDPNPHIDGRGIALLKSAGIRTSLIDEVCDDCFADILRALRDLNEDFSKFIRTGLPFVYAKYAMTLDGNIATSEGDSFYISNEESRKFAHSLRNRVDAILVGIGTVLSDNPRLDVRLVKKHKDPLRIIIDPYGKTSHEFNVMKDIGQTLFITGDNIPQGFIDLCRKHRKTVKTFPLPFNFSAVMKYLGSEMKIESVLIEGGGKVLYNAVNSRIIDKLLVFIAPKILGGKGIQPFEGISSIKMSSAIKLYDISVENINGDILFQGYMNESKRRSKETL